VLKFLDVTLRERKRERERERETERETERERERAAFIPTFPQPSGEY
jgi:hypothetical protein